MKKNKEIAKMNVNIESEICSYCHLAQERIKTDVSNPNYFTHWKIKFQLRFTHIEV